MLLAILLADAMLLLKLYVLLIAKAQDRGMPISDKMVSSWAGPKKKKKKKSELSPVRCGKMHFDFIHIAMLLPDGQRGTQLVVPRVECVLICDHMMKAV